MKWIKLNKHEGKKQWHNWFAWYPVSVGVTPDKDDKMVWLSTVQRCGIYHHSNWTDSYWIFKYRSVP